MKKTTANLTLAPRQSAAPTAAIPRSAAFSVLQQQIGLCTRAWKWIQSKRAVGSGPRRLHLAETVSLGEKRFVAVIHVDGVRLLIGGSSSSVSLLTELKPLESFDSAMTKAKAKRKPAARRKEKAA